MKYFYYIFLALTIAVTSCKNNEKESVQPGPLTGVPFPGTATSNLQNQTPQTAVVNEHNLFHEKNPVSSPAPSVVSATNPAHGQPNHRCDIPVGAPLNSAVNNTTKVAPQTNVQPTPTITKVVAPVKTVTPKGMNPPHGEPGHRCDIAVGQPLNSKPTTTTNSATETVQKQETNNSNVPALLMNDSPETKTQDEKTSSDAK